MTDENTELTSPINEVEILGATTNTKFPGFERLGMTVNSGRNSVSEGNVTAFGTNYLLIPPRFLEYVVLRESIATIRVVSYLLFKALVATDPVIAEIEAPYEEMAKTLTMSKMSVRNGITRAVEAGYIRQTFDGNTSRTRPSRYSVIWADEPDFESELAGTPSSFLTSITTADPGDDTAPSQPAPPEPEPEPEPGPGPVQSLLGNLAAFRATVVRPVTRWQLSYQFAATAANS